ncbi:MAG: preprotein translocase subunit YajC [Spirochaetia bacterium]|nr:preprotein translocase subunit YajC [Spirochaetia bacterium]
MFETALYASGSMGAPAAGAAEQPSMLATFLPLIIIFVLFYFMFIMPQRKEQKKTREMLKALKEGDKVVTNGGIVGVITKINETEDTLTIACGENTKINVLRAYVTKKFEKPVEKPAA